MDYSDVFNGDADGICALHQLRLRQPRPSARLVSGVKRDISLLSRLTGTRDKEVTVLDVSLDKNRDSLIRLLADSNRVFYADHHFAGDLPDSANLTALIDPAPLTCTSLIINEYLHGEFSLWAVVGAFGDNLDEPASQLATSLGVDSAAVASLRETGILLNYNGYGATLEDLFFHPVELFHQVQPFVDPLLFHAESRALRVLKKGYYEDIEQALSFTPIHQDASGRVYQLPAVSWARRVAGVYSNTLARQQPELAHALLTASDDGSLRISVRAPLENRNGADDLCRQFPTGGGRAAAAGINALPPEQLDAFIQAFSRQFS